MEYKERQLQPKMGPRFWLQSHMGRFWVNQPSTLQPCHDLHARRVIAPSSCLKPSDDSVTVYFASGDADSALIPRIALSAGWPAGTT